MGCCHVIGFHGFNVGKWKPERLCWGDGVRGINESSTAESRTLWVTTHSPGWLMPCRLGGSLLIPTPLGFTRCVQYLVLAGKRSFSTQ